MADQMFPVVDCKPKTPVQIRKISFSTQLIFNAFLTFKNNKFW